MEHDPGLDQNQADVPRIVEPLVSTLREFDALQDFKKEGLIIRPVLNFQQLSKADRRQLKPADVSYIPEDQLFTTHPDELGDMPAEARNQWLIRYNGIASYLQALEPNDIHLMATHSRKELEGLLVYSREMSDATRRVLYGKLGIPYGEPPKRAEFVPLPPVIQKRGLTDRVHAKLFGEVYEENEVPQTTAWDTKPGRRSERVKTGARVPRGVGNATLHELGITPMTPAEKATIELSKEGLPSRAVRHTTAPVVDLVAGLANLRSNAELLVAEAQLKAEAEEEAANKPKQNLKPSPTPRSKSKG